MIDPINDMMAVCLANEYFERCEKNYFRRAPVKKEIDLESQALIFNIFAQREIDWHLKLNYLLTLKQVNSERKEQP